MNQQNAHCLCDVFFLRLNYIYNIFTLYYACYISMFILYRGRLFLTSTGMPHNSVLVNKGLHIQQQCMTQPRCVGCTI